MRWAQTFREGDFGNEEEEEDSAHEQDEQTERFAFESASGRFSTTLSTPTSCPSPSLSPELRLAAKS